MNLENKITIENKWSDRIFISLMPMVSNFMSYSAEIISARKFNTDKNIKYE